MEFDRYKEIIKNDERVDWYGEMVPETLITTSVRTLAVSIAEGIIDLEGELTDYKKGSKEWISKENYLLGLKKNLQHLPYTSNGLINDVYMVKYRRIIKEIEKESPKKKPKTLKTRKPNDNTTPKPNDVTPTVECEKEPTETPVVKSRRGKNYNLIFGKK
jgi:hypothetical protein